MIHNILKWEILFIFMSIVLYVINKEFSIFMMLLVIALTLIKIYNNLR